MDAGDATPLRCSNSDRLPLEGLRVLDTFEVDSDLEVRFRQYLLAVILLSIPPFMLIELGAELIAGELSTGETLGLFFGFLLPGVAAYFFIEFGQFTFSKRNQVFSWRWRNMIYKDSGEVPLQRVVKIRRDGLEASDLIGWQNSYRLIAVLDDGRIIPLTRSYSGQHGKKLDQIVDQLRDYLGHMVDID